MRAKFGPHVGLRTFLCLALGLTASAQSVIYTFAGNHTSGYTGDGGLATNAKISTLVLGMTTDSAGNLYFSDYGNCAVRKVDLSGIITTIAGNGTCTSTGDGGLATSATVLRPVALTFDQAGNLYFGEDTIGRVRRVDTAGIITTVAGTGTSGFSGDNGPATSAKLTAIAGLAFDASGNLYLSDFNNGRIRKINTSGIISTFAGGGSILGDGGPATSASLSNPFGLAVDTAGNLYIAERSSNRVRKVDTSGVITTFAGTGTSGTTGEGGPAASAKISSPWAVSFDTTGNLYIAEGAGNRVRRVNSAGNIETVAGTGTAGSSGDGGPALNATVKTMYGIYAASNNRVYLADSSNSVIRVLTPGRVTQLPATAVASTSATTTVTFGQVTGLGTTAALISGAEFTLDPAGCTYSAVPSFQATCPVTFTPQHVGLRWDAVRITDTNGNLVSLQYLYGVGQGPVATVTPGVISTFDLSSVGSIAAAGAVQDSTGALYVADSANNRIIKMPVGGTAAPLAISGATLSAPKGLVLDGAGNLYVADSGNNRIVAVAADGTATIPSISGLSNPTGLAMNTARTLFIADTGNGRVVKYNLDGSVSTLTVTPTLTSPVGLAFDPAGTLYIADSAAPAIVKVTAAGASSALTISGFTLGTPSGLATDPAGNLYVADTSRNQIIRINAGGVAVIIAGTGTAGNTGNGGLATSADITASGSVFLDLDGALYFNDATDGIVREVSGSPTITFADTTLGSTDTESANFSNIGNIGITFPSSFAFTQNSGPFTLTAGAGDCSTFLGSSFAAGGSCIIHAQFAPISAGQASNTLTLTGGLQITFNGAGIGVAASSVDSNTLTFGTQIVATSSAGRTVTLTNSGTGALAIAGIAISGANANDFARTSTCSTTLAAGGHCTMTVIFTPSSAAAESGSLVITASDAVSHAALNQTVALSGTGVAAPIITATVSTNSLNFGNVASGSSSTQTATVTNSGTGTLHIASAAITGTNAGDFTLVNHCPAALAAGAQCTLTVQFHPSTPGAQTANLTLMDDATSTAGFPSGFVPFTSVRYVSSASPNGDRIVVGDSFLAARNTILQMPLPSSPNQRFADPLIELAPGQSFANVYVPTAAERSGDYSAFGGAVIDPTTGFPFAGNIVPSSRLFGLYVFRIGPGGITSSAQSIALSGTGTAALSGSASLDASSLTFANQAPGTTASAQTVTLTNTGGASLTISGVSITGSDATEFALTNNCGATLASGASCTVQVVFSPASTGSKSGNIQFSFTDGQNTTSSNVTLTGISSVATATVPTGVIRIVSQNSGKALDVMDASTLNGGVLQQYDYLSGQNQMWEAIAVDETYYKIRNVATGKVLDATGGKTANGTMVQQWNYLGGDNQKWQFVSQADGSFEIVNKLSGRALDVLGVSMKNQARIQLWDYNGTDNQKWQITAVNVPPPTVQYYTISSLATGKVLDIVNASVKDNARVQQYDYWRGANQQWQFVPTTDGYYMIVSRLTGKVLDAMNTVAADGAPVQQYPYVGGDNQQWQLVPTANGYYQIVNRRSGKSLDVTGMSPANMALLQTYTYWGGPNQQFEVTPVLIP